MASYSEPLIVASTSVRCDASAGLGSWREEEAPEETNGGSSSSSSSDTGSGCRPGLSQLVLRAWPWLNNDGSERWTLRKRKAGGSEERREEHHKCVKLPLVDDSGRLNIELYGYPKLNLYFSDLFHTLVNMPLKRFVVVLICVYVSLFFVFSIPFYQWAVSNNCIPGVHSLLHAFWFSVQTSMTIGFGGDLTPDPDCTVVNIFVTLLSIFSLLLAYSLLGIIYVKFSRPTKRASTIVFSTHMVVHEENGVPHLVLRVANARKHQVIGAHVRMLVSLNNVLTGEEESAFKFTSLPILGGSQLYLGLPCHVVHPISHSSPLHGLTYTMMEKCDLEILVLLEAVDASTSAAVQARHSYRPSDMKHNHRFATMVYRLPNGHRCVDFSLFNVTVPVSHGPSLPPLAIPSRSTSPPLIPPILHTPRALPSANTFSMPRSQASLFSAAPLHPALPLASQRFRAGRLPTLLTEGSGRGEEEEMGSGVGRRGEDEAMLMQGGDHGDEFEKVEERLSEMEMDFEQQTETIEENGRWWRHQVIELAARVQHCHFKAEGDMEHLVSYAAMALSRAMDFDEQ